MALALGGKARGKQTAKDLGVPVRGSSRDTSQPGSGMLRIWGQRNLGDGKQSRKPDCRPLRPQPGSVRTSSSSPESDSGSTGTSSSSPIVPMKPSSSSMLPEQLLPEISTARRPTLLFRDALVVTADITSALRKPRRSNRARTLRVRMRQRGAWLRESKSRGGDLFQSNSIVWCSESSGTLEDVCELRRSLKRCVDKLCLCMFMYKKLWKTTQ